ncbi:MAG: hypothetical protein RDA78_03050 [Roseibium sp.]|uniref:hypothetical protein n=1 Tax=Roseibium sp. TaxID=1936156 RepID=UPI003D9C5903
MQLIDPGDVPRALTCEGTVPRPWQQQNPNAWGEIKCAREHGAKRVVASADAHVSVPKSAHILGLPFESIAVLESGCMDTGLMPDLTNAALVLTAGTTGRGVIDDLDLAGKRLGKSGGPSWVHVDASPGLAPLPRALTSPESRGSARWRQTCTWNWTRSDRG